MFKPTGRPTRRWIGTVIVLLALIGALWWNQHSGLRATTRETRALTEALARNAVQDCKEIEHLKYRVRFNAQKNFKEVKENARLLNIPLTPELLAKVRREYHATLRRYASDPCPRNREK